MKPTFKEFKKEVKLFMDDPLTYYLLASIDGKNFYQKNINFSIRYELDNGWFGNKHEILFNVFYNETECPRYTLEFDSDKEREKFIPKLEKWIKKILEE